VCYVVRTPVAQKPDAVEKSLKDWQDFMAAFEGNEPLATVAYSAYLMSHQLPPKVIAYRALRNARKK